MNMMRSVGKILASLAIAAPFAMLATVAQASLVISQAPTTNVTCSLGVCTATDTNAVLSVGKLKHMLGSSSVKVVSGSLAQDIEFDAALTWISSNALTLDSYHSIKIDKPVSVAGAAGLTITTNDGGSGGTLSFGAGGDVTFLSTSNHLVLDGKIYKLESNIKTLAYDIARNPKGNFALANSYDASVDGVYSVSPISASFDGAFNGLGNVISKIEIVDESTDGNVGFFATTLAKASISSIGFVKAGIQANSKFVGGFVGANSGTINNSSFSGTIAAGASGISGGLVGDNEGTIANCRSAGIVRGLLAAGLVGENGGTIERSFATAAVTGFGRGEAGGLVGENYSFAGPTIVDSYATGAVIVEKKTGTAGGLVGQSSFAIRTSYSTGAVSGGAKSALGGFAGSSADTENTYWDTTTSGITDLSKGAGYPTNAPGITGLTTSQLQSGLPAGFDPAIWGEDPGINGGLPYLLGNPPPP